MAGSTVSICTGASTQPSLKIFPLHWRSSSRFSTPVASTGSVVALISLLSSSAAAHPAASARACDGARDRIRSAAFSAIIIVVACVFARVIVGITDASTTRSPSTP